MRVLNQIFSLAAIFILAACSPKFSYTWTQPNYEKGEIDKILIHGISQTPGKATLFENTMAGVFKDNGIEAISSALTYGNKYSEADLETKLQKLLNDGVDAILTVAVVDQNTETVYNQGMTYSVPAYGRTYRGYAYRTNVYVQEPGYYSQETTYLLETNLYKITDVTDKGDALVWAAQSEESEPGNVKKFNQKYCELIMEQLKADGIL